MDSTFLLFLVAVFSVALSLFIKKLINFMYSNDSLLFFMIYTFNTSFLISGHTHTQSIHSKLSSLPGV